MNQPQNISEYIEAFPEDVQLILKMIRTTLKKVAPNSEEAIKYGMPTFMFKNKALVYFGAFKNHIGLYALPCGNEAFKEELKKYKTGKGSIQFQLNEAIPYSLIEKIATFRMLEIGKQ